MYYRQSSLCSTDLDVGEWRTETWGAVFERMTPWARMDYSQRPLAAFSMNGAFLERLLDQSKHQSRVISFPVYAAAG